MKKLVLAFMLILACFCMIGCKDANNVEPPVTEQPEIIEKPVTIEAVETTGKIGEPKVSASGEAVLTCKDSKGGTYTFKQQVARAVESSGTWEYSKNEIVLFSGTFSGDINVTAEAPLSSLNLTVTKAADKSGKLIETTEAKTFDFNVEPAGTFNATIPAVEIVVEVVVDPNNPETTEETKALLNEAVDLLMKGDIDGGIAKISKAYDGQKNDETKMYYALAELASISVDESVSTLLTENIGIKNYPSKMNALLNGEWLKEYKVTENRDAPVEGLESVTTAEQLSMQIIINLIDCNPDGLIDLIDNILAVFGEKFENAKALAASISNASVALPEELFDALELEEVLGKSSLKVGKAELNILVASMEILQGTFQWISSYDWSVNIASIKDALPINEESEGLDLDFFRKLINKKTLAVRNAKAMEASKESFIDAIDMIVGSYDYLVGDTSEYPQAAIDAIKEYGDKIKPEALKVKTAIKNGEVYTIQESDFRFSIDLGKFFQSGYFSNLIEKDDNGGLQLYLNIGGNYIDDNGYIFFNEYVKLSSTTTAADLEQIASKWLETYMKENGITQDQLDDPSICIVFKLNGSYLDKLLPGLFPAEYVDNLYMICCSF